jgi:hypothetical protein
VRILVTAARASSARTWLTSFRQSHEVGVFDRLEEQLHPGRRCPQYLSVGVELIMDDVRDRRALIASIRDSEVVSHLASRRRRRAVDVRTREPPVAPRAVKRGEDVA